ncbi:Oxalate--CoA ligase [Acrodontium crateriforme]|uniref:Oxalate--CoA ligase n=1 Tax=Acrodontium crateriforme TaxID=150365 RepID=A0AAQ3M3N0_9PEZI|nr:Oxalate--CoA ligase [Acrodontium crateriforme]
MAEINKSRSPLDLYASILHENEINIYHDFLRRALCDPQATHSQLLDSIPRSSQSSYAPIATLSCLLVARSGKWPILKLQQTTTELWKLMPEEAKAGYGPEQAQRLQRHVLHFCKDSYSSLLDFLDLHSSSTALIDPDTGRSISHHRLARSIHSFALPLQTAENAPKPIIAISLPNGPLLALTVLATATYYTAAPIAHGSGVGADQFRSDVLQSKSNIVIASLADVERLGLNDDWLRDAKIIVLLVSLSEDMRLVVRDLDGASVLPPVEPPILNTAYDTGIMLFTSGTSGTKKLVPLSIHSMVCGVAMVIESWGLSPSMRCLNQMPLNHVGGLIRNLFAPIFSGGSVICCSAFDANLFWDCIEDYNPTWYYASPSMHQCILEAGKDRPESLSKSKIRLICNAAGGLLPSLACQLRDTFSVNGAGCTVLPSYGMTECMPISTPPLDYKLEKAGTSGVSVGPELCILDGRDQVEKTGIVGRIAVRGAPVFGGYLRANNAVDTSCFTRNGWFDTGDMGYMDEQGFLYITGRSKEVINRGGELISPFEVEEAVVAAASNPQSRTYGRIGKALAFSVTHDILQEVVGIAVVTPSGAKRACLRSIQDSVKSALSSVKIPLLVVYMDDGVPTNNNKVLRINLANRLDIPEISDITPQALRHYEAASPPINSPITQKIECQLLQITHDCLAMVCQDKIPESFDLHIRKDSSQFYPEVLLAPKSHLDEEDPIHLSPEAFIRKVSNALHSYHLPDNIIQLEKPFPRNRDGSMNEDAVNALLQSRSTSKDSTSNTGSTESIVSTVFAEILALPKSHISRSSDFFELGGNSMAAGQLLSKLRKEFKLRLPINVLFTNSQVAGLSALIDEKLGKDQGPTKTAVYQEELVPGCWETRSSSNPFLMTIQLIPVGIIYPMKRAFTWTVFMCALSVTQNWPTNETLLGRLFDLVLCIGIARVFTRAAAPLFAILFKWLVMGRYKEGLYPMWGLYHTRWWMCQKVIQVCGKGHFGLFNWSRILYYRCLGTKIGTNVSMSAGAELGEYDLITIADGVTLDRCTVRAFAAERNTSMYLGRISIGADASIGLKSIVAPGTNVSANACIGANSSSWETADADEVNRDLSSSKIPDAHWTLELFCGIPIQFLTKFMGALPWLAALSALVLHEPARGPDLLRQIMIWFSSPKRVVFHYAALGANSALASTFVFISVYVVKKLFDAFCGTLTPTMAHNRSHITKFRMQIMQTLMPAPQFHKLTEMFGGHYEMTSILARAMGARIGKRVYWPGTGPSIQDFPLLDIGDDVVFGSRAHLVTSDGTGSNFIRINSGSMVADRVVLLPGVELGANTVMGSGALTKRDTLYPSGTTWVGAKKNEAVCLTSNDTARSSALTLGNRATLYRRLIMQAPVDTANSSSTTLAHGLDSEASSILTDDWSPPNYKVIDIEKGLNDFHHSEFGPACTPEKSSKTPPARGESSSPFGRAFYEGKAPYRVWGQFFIFCYSTTIIITNAIWWDASSISAMQVIGYHFKHRTSIYETFLVDHWYRPIALYTLFTSLIAIIMAIQAILTITFMIVAKWWLMGERIQGNYDWDKSSYCQRWQLYLKLETFRRHCYGGHGILGLLTGTRWISMYFESLGATLGKDCALFAGGLPSLMFTEPDLVTLGDRVSVDDASLVAHINTRGRFDLNPLYVGDRSVLRSGSRLLSGARMEADSCLLEHTLVMAGDVVDEGSTSQGWPAEQFSGARMPTMKPKQVWALA